MHDRSGPPSPGLPPTGSNENSRSSSSSKRKIEVKSPTPINASVQAVRINCDTECTMLYKPLYEKVFISPTDPIFRSGRQPDVPKRVGITLCTRTADKRSAREEQQLRLWADDESGNFEAEILHTAFRPEESTARTRRSSTWGDMDAPKGSVLVARKDLKPLSPCHVRALFEYCHDSVDALIARSLAEDPFSLEPLIDKKKAAGMVNQGSFFLFWHAFKISQGHVSEGGDCLADVCCPVDMAG